MSTVAGLATRERLLAAARELIEDGGYGSASVAAIAERAGVAAGTLYRHFASKEDLFVDVFRSVCAGEERAMRIAATTAHHDASAAERLQDVLSTFAQRALRNPQLAWALIAEPVDPRVDAERIAYRARYAELIADVLEAGIVAGELPAQDARLYGSRARRRVCRGARRAAVAGGRIQGRSGGRGRRDPDVRGPGGRWGMNAGAGIRVERAGPVTTVLLTRPERRNAVDAGTADALAQAFREFDEDADAAVAILHGEGGVFCAGR